MHIYIHISLINLSFLDAKEYRVRCNNAEFCIGMGNRSVWSFSS